MPQVSDPTKNDCEKNGWINITNFSAKENTSMYNGIGVIESEHSFYFVVYVDDNTNRESFPIAENELIFGAKVKNYEESFQNAIINWSNGDVDEVKLRIVRNTLDKHKTNAGDIHDIWINQEHIYNGNQDKPKDINQLKLYIVKNI